MRRVLDLAGPILCGLAAALLLIAAVAVELDSRPARIMILAAGILFVPGAILTLVYVRRNLGPPR